MDVHNSSATPFRRSEKQDFLDKVRTAGQNPELDLEIQAWAELLLDYHEYKRQRESANPSVSPSIDAFRRDLNMEAKVD